MGLHDKFNDQVEPNIYNESDMTHSYLSSSALSDLSLKRKILKSDFTGAVDLIRANRQLNTSLIAVLVLCG